MTDTGPMRQVGRPPLRGGTAGVTTLVDAVRRAGDARRVTLALHIEGLYHAASVTRLETRVRAIRGVTAATANPADEMLRVEYVPDVAAPADVEAAVVAAGFTLSEPGAGDDPVEADRLRREGEARVLRRRLIVAVIGAAVTAAGSLPLLAGGTRRDLFGSLLALLEPAARTAAPWLFRLDPGAIRLGLLAVTLAVMLGSGRELYLGAWRAVRQRVADTNVLVALGTLVAFLYAAVGAIGPVLFGAAPPAGAYFEVVSVVIALVLGGRLLESRARGQMAEAIRDLMNLRAVRARVARDGQEDEVSVHEVVVGDRVRVRPGERVPVDGIVVEGETQVSELMLSGEPTPVAKQAGAAVIAGTTNGPGSVLIEVTMVGEDTMLERIIGLVEQAQASRAPVHRVADRVAAMLAPAVVALAVLAFVIWYDFGPDPAIVFAMVTLVTTVVVACPNAVGLATPTAIMVATGRGARSGVLFRNAHAVESLPRVTTLVVSRTGTITEGEPAVTHVVPRKTVDGRAASPQVIVRLAASVEQRSQHPIARAITRTAHERNVSTAEPAKFVVMEGRGVRGVVEGRLVEVISLRHARERNVELGNVTDDGERMLAEGRTPVVVVVNDSVQGLIAVLDPMKPTAPAAIQQLREAGLRVVLLSGNQHRAVERVAGTLGVDDFMAEVLPSQKASFVERLQQRGERVAVVGDAVDDAAALTQADVGIAVGAGADVQSDAADVMLVGGDPRAAAFALELSRRTIRTMRQNLVWAFGYHLLAIPLAAGLLYPFTGMLVSPVVAAAAMAFSSLSVVTNSLRLRRFTPTCST